MRYGYVVQNFGYAPTLVDLSFPRIKEAAMLCEELGFESLWVADHLGTDMINYTGHLFECFTLLSALSPCTDSARLGSLVACNLFRHPSILAKISSNLDVISGGRLEFGIGAGWVASEAEAYGLGFPGFNERIERLREGLEIITRMWCEDRPRFDGKYYSIEEPICDPKPVQKPHPPITIGGTGEKTIELVAEYAQGWNIPLSSGLESGLSSIVKKIELLEKRCEQIGRDPGEITKSTFCYVLTSDDPEDIDKTITDHQEYVDVYCNRSADELKAKHIVGDAETCIEKIEGIEEIGIDTVMLKFLDFPSLKGPEYFGREVIGRM